MEPLTPINAAPLFPPLLRELIALLRGLEADAWQLPTLAGRWRVRDVAAHMLDGDLRRLAATRDGHPLAPERRARSYEDVVILIDDLNATGVRYARRLSPRLLTDLLEQTGGWVATLMAELPPEGDATFPVAWAGEERSANWMDIGREFTEKWHHQMHIRDAVGAPGLLQRQWLTPLFDISVRALPRAYQSTLAPPGTAVVLEVTEEADYVWSIVREGSGWRVYRGRTSAPLTTVRVAPDDAWRLLYNALSAERAREVLQIEGDHALAEPLIAARSVMV